MAKESPSVEKAAKAAKKPNQKVRQGVASRYRAMVVILTLFVVFVVALLGGSYWAGVYLSRQATLMSQLGMMDTSVAQMTKSMYALKMGSSDTPFTPLNKVALEDLKARRESINGFLKIYDKGGEFTDMHGDKTTISAMSGSALDHMRNFQKGWGEIDQKLGQYIATAQSISADPALMVNAFNAVQTGDLSLRAEVTQASALTEEQFNRVNLITEVAQIVAIVLSIILLIVFIRFFIARLVESDRQTEAARDEIDQIMGTVDSGLFLVDNKLQIGSQYSNKLESLIGMKEIAGQNLNNLLIKLVDKSQIETTASYINQLYNAKIKEKLVADLNPLDRVEVIQRDGKKSYLKFNFNRVVRDKQILRVLGNVTDITQQVQLEKRLEEEVEKNSQAQKDSLQRLSMLANVDPLLVEEFINKAQTTANNINETLKQQNPSEAYLRMKLDSIYREIHTLKGDASAIRLQSFVSLANRFEEKLKALKVMPHLGGEDFLPLAVMLNELIILTQALVDMKADHGGSVSAPLTRAESFIQNLQTFTQDLAIRHNKSAGVTFEGMEILNKLPNETVSMVRSIVIQILRNAVVHGIEAPQVRKAKGKLPVGHVHVDLRAAPDGLYFSVSDDGKGIDYEALRAKAAQTGMTLGKAVQDLTQGDLNKLMFSPGFSTLAVANDDAGRGVGLDAVRSQIMTAHGKLGISTAADKFTRFDFKIPLE